MRTYYAPGERFDEDIILNQKRMIENSFALDAFDSLPFAIIVLNSYRQIVFFNKQYQSIVNTDNIFGRRPGETMGCTKAHDNEGGCGTARGCKYCGAVNVMLKSLNSGKEEEGEARIAIDDNGLYDSVDLYIKSSPFKVKNELFALISIRDLSSEKRKNVLERIFLHDIANLSSSIGGLANIIEKTDSIQKSRELASIMKSAIGELNDEISSQRTLLMAENNSWNTVIVEIGAKEIIHNNIEKLKHTSLCSRFDIVIDNEDDIPIKTDKTLISRILINLMKNACEANYMEKTINVGFYKEQNQVVFYVKNDFVMTEETKSQVFQRSFSTKGDGRGLGTYSIKLLTTKYLNGKVWFKSDEDCGTVFFCSFPAFN